MSSFNSLIDSSNSSLWQPISLFQTPPQQRSLRQQGASQEASQTAVTTVATAALPTRSSPSLPERGSLGERRLSNSNPQKQELPSFLVLRFSSAEERANEILTNISNKKETNRQSSSGSQKNSSLISCAEGEDNDPTPIREHQQTTAYSVRELEEGELKTKEMVARTLEFFYKEQEKRGVNILRRIVKKETVTTINRRHPWDLFAIITVLKNAASFNSEAAEWRDTKLKFKDPQQGVYRFLQELFDKMLQTKQQGETLEAIPFGESVIYHLNYAIHYEKNNLLPVHIKFASHTSAIDNECYTFVCIRGNNENLDGVYTDSYSIKINLEQLCGIKNNAVVDINPAAAVELASNALSDKQQQLYRQGLELLNRYFRTYVGFSDTNAMLMAFAIKRLLSITCNFNVHACEVQIPDNKDKAFELLQWLVRNGVPRKPPEECTEIKTQFPELYKAFPDTRNRFPIYEYERSANVPKIFSLANYKFSNGFHDDDAAWTHIHIPASNNQQAPVEPAFYIIDDFHVLVQSELQRLEAAAQEKSGASAAPFPVLLAFNDVTRHIILEAFAEAEEPRLKNLCAEYLQLINDNGRLPEPRDIGSAIEQLFDIVRFFGGRPKHKRMPTQLWHISGKELCAFTYKALSSIAVVLKPYFLSDQEIDRMFVSAGVPPLHSLNEGALKSFTITVLSRTVKWVCLFNEHGDCINIILEIEREGKKQHSRIKRQHEKSKQTPEVIS